MNEPSLKQKLDLLVAKWIEDLVQNDKDIVRASGQGDQDVVARLEGFGICLDRCSDELLELIVE